MEVVVGIDVGSSRIKVGAYSRSGELEHLLAVPTPVRDSAHGTDFPVLEILDVVEAGLAHLGTRGLVARAIGIGTMGEVGTLLVDGRLVDLAFPAWYDERGRAQVARLEEAFGRRYLDGATGGHVRPTSTGAKLAWLGERGHELGGVFLGVAGAVAWRLTGEAYQEASLAATSGAWDPVGRRYLPDLWAAWGLAEVAPADVREPGYAAPAASQVAAALGLDEGVPVVVAGHDHPLAAVGAGAVPGEVVDSLGTGEALLATASSQGLDRERVADLVALGVTVESWPTSTDALLIHEGLRPGVAMTTFLRRTGGERAALEAGAPPPGVVRVDPRLVTGLEAGGECRLPPGSESWAGILDHYARAAARSEAQLRAAAGATGVTVLTGGGLRSARWLAAKTALGGGRLVVSTALETVARGAAAVAGATLGWWVDAAEMPGAARLTTDKTELTPP